MEPQETADFAQRKKPLYDAIPLVIFDKLEGKGFKVKGEDPRYNVLSPVCMSFRLLLFWTLWTALVMAMIVTIFAHFWFTTRNSHRSNTHENVNATSSKHNVS